MSQERVEYKCSFVFTKSQYDAAEYNLVCLLYVYLMEVNDKICFFIAFPD